MLLDPTCSDWMKQLKGFILIILWPTMYLLERWIGVEPDWNGLCIGVGLNPSICTTGLGRVNGSEAVLDASSPSSISDPALIEPSSGNKTQCMYNECI